MSLIIEKISQYMSAADIESNDKHKMAMVALEGVGDYLAADLAKAIINAQEVPARQCRGWGNLDEDQRQSCIDAVKEIINEAAKGQR